VGIADTIAATVRQATATNVDGTVVVGDSDAGAWIWDSSDGAKTIKAVVANLGFSTDGYDLRTLNAVSSDGKTVVGGTSTPSGIDRTYVVRDSPTGLTPKAGQKRAGKPGAQAICAKGTGGFNLRDDGSGI
jgi:hypothetical protein